MAIIALTTLFAQVAAAGSGGTAPGGNGPPAAGFTLTTPTDISGNVKTIDSMIDVAEQDVTTFGTGGYMAFVAGLKSGTMQLDVFNDLAAAALNSLLGINGTVLPVGALGFIEVRASSAVRSATNPSFVAAIINRGWKPFAANVGAPNGFQWSPQITKGFGELVA